MQRPAFQDTQPASMAALSGHAIDEFRVDDPVEALALLRRLVDAGTLIHLSGPSGSAYTSVLWAVDAHARRITLDADPTAPAVRAMVESGEACAVAYLDAIKLQFDLGNMMLVHGATGSALQAALPAALYRFQRRSSFRVRTPGGACVQLRHPALPEMMLTLRVLDVSLGGCALWLPADVPPLAAGTRLSEVEITLDADTRFGASLVLAHVGALLPGGAGVRVGCEWRLAGSGERSLQRWIDQAQKRRRLMSLE